MKSDGYGGRAGNNQFSEAVINGLIDLEEKPPPIARQCKNPKCQRFFPSRQEGDSYCTDLCDAQFRGNGGSFKTDADGSGSWDNAVKTSEG